MDSGSSTLQRRFVGLNSLTGLTFGFTAPVTAVLAGQLGASPFAAGLVVASLTAVVFLCDIFGTRLLPFLEPRRAISAGLLLWGVGSFVSAVAPDVQMLTAARIGQGFGLAMQAAAAPQLAIRLAGNGRVGAAVGRFQAAMTAGSAIAPLTGGLVTAIGIGTTGNRLAFAICGILAVIAAAFAWFVLPTVRPLLRPRLSRPRLPGLSVSPRSITALLVSSVGQGARGAVSLTLVPLIAAGSMGLAGPRVGVFLTTAYLTEVAITAIGGGWSDRHGRRPVVLLGTGAGIFAMILLGVAVRTGSMVAFFAATLPIGIAGGCMLGLLPAVLVDLAGGPEAGLSANRIARDFGSTSCTVIIGAITGLAGTTGGLITGVLMFVVVAIGIRVIGETRALQS
ncbi:hypothetical protein GCM10011575_30030 [Microlunatus endophyticus]|uniref:Major facilitator superfamily (MFS) profile domain-containing protein n=1 Tax=Microlunatus endophyticus TaxID=1716077 RepID=A0A917SBN9_9ACTN|nr:MFS transporter [Microlunatus endophyticus]GGL69409.1 hypothetical protein GCM10011575_30030 [Microlunatus endophyticus]